MSHHFDDDDDDDQEERLPSALDNFIKQFWGSVQKVRAEDGTISWILPCDLDVGVPANPRLPDEGVACYFFRLFNEGLTGLTGNDGPTGPTGPTGAGENSYSTTAVNFTVPAIGGTVSVVLAKASWVAVGGNLFISTTGYYKVVGKSGNTVQLQFIVDTTGFSGTVTAGKAVEASGPLGPTGVTGDKTVFVFKRSAFTPTTPTGNGTPTGWSLTPPVGFDPLWMSLAEQTFNNVLVSALWSGPIEIMDMATTAIDIGSSGEDVYQEKIGSELVFRRLASGTGISITLEEGGDPSTDSLLRISTVYSPGTPANWAGSPPTSFAAAIDRLAAASPGA